jgi:hypothetical protein
VNTTIDITGFRGFRRVGPKDINEEIYTLVMNAGILGTYPTDHTVVDYVHVPLGQHSRPGKRHMTVVTMQVADPTESKLREGISCLHNALSRLTGNRQLVERMASVIRGGSVVLENETIREGVQTGFKRYVERHVDSCLKDAFSSCMQGGDIKDAVSKFKRSLRRSMGSVLTEEELSARMRMDGLDRKSIGKIINARNAETKYHHLGRAYMGILTPLLSELYDIFEEDQLFEGLLDLQDKEAMKGIRSLGNIPSLDEWTPNP